jgi:hypothetical protein
MKYNNIIIEWLWRGRFFSLDAGVVELANTAGFKPATWQGYVGSNPTTSINLLTYCS